MDSRPTHRFLDRALRPTRSVFAVLALTTLGAWLADAGGVGLSAAANRAIVAGALVAGVAWLALAVGVRWRRQPDDPVVTPGRVLVVLVLLSLLTSWAGIGFELLDHYHNDEGVFYVTAEQINDGALLPEAFNYGHFLYYASALVLWVQELFPQATTAFAQSVFGYETQGAVGRLLLRGLSATLGALTTVPVFIIGLRVSGLLAGALGGALILLSPLYITVSQLAISDVPAGFFAAMTLMFVANLLDGENWRDYLLAGISAGLAAGSKYPGGVAAVAIIGIWVYWRVRTRRFSWHLLGAGLVSLAAFLAIMPGLWINAGEAFSGSGLDITFGWRQYAKSGWLGTMPRSNLAWYSGRILHNFGIAALLVGISGLLVLERENRRRLLALLPFPVVYVWLIISMNMVVMRNLQPVLPALAAVLGVGAAAWSFRIVKGTRLSSRWVVTAICIVTLAIPAGRTVARDVAHMRPGTRQLAMAFIEQNYPWGTGVIHEAYTPKPNHKRNPRLGGRTAAAWPMEEIRSAKWELAMLTPMAYRRFFEEQRGDRPWVTEYRARYEQMFTFPLVKEFAPGLFRAGPRIYIYQIDPETIDYTTHRTFGALDVAFVSNPAIRQGKAGEVLGFKTKNRNVLFKDFFEPGTYRIEFAGDFDTADGALFVYTRDNEEVAVLDLAIESSVELPRRDKYFFRLFLKPSRSLTAFTVSRIEDPEA